MEQTSFAAASNRAWNTPWNNSWNRRRTDLARRKPNGGFRFIPAIALMRAWWAYKQGIIRLYDLRVWFACHEAVSRRCIVRPNRFPRYAFEEIHRLVEGRQSANVQTAVRRLSNAGLLDWSERKIQFPVMKSEGTGDADRAWNEMISLVDNHRRKVPVPRRTLRFLAEVSRPVSIATVLGHLLRCLYYRNGMCEPSGRCKSSWVADVFGVDVRNVKAARRELAETRWLVVHLARQTAMNRWGAAVTINLAWNLEQAPASSELPLRPSVSTTESPPPRRNRKLSSRTENQKPAIAARTGAHMLALPSLRHVRIEDLHDVRRIDELLAEAWKRRLVPQGDAARLRFHSAAAHALRVGRQNPAGLFAVFIRRGLWKFLSGADEDLARQRLASACRPPPRQFHRGLTHSAPASHPTHARVVLEQLVPRLGAMRTNAKLWNSIGWAPSVCRA